MQTLFTFFFKLGGVLVATSNRLPEGLCFVIPTFSFSHQNTNISLLELYSTDFRKAQFAMFFRILQARCVSHDMRSSNDYREILSDPENADKLLLENKSTDKEGDDSTTLLPPKIDFYQIKSDTQESEDKWAESIQNLTDADEFLVKHPDSVTVYGRKVNVPWQHKGTAFFDFEDICETPLAAADYISLASRYHTFIIDNVPALKTNQKNEARRLITLLDALYECRCRLLIRSEAAPEDLFFADVRDRVNGEEEKEESKSIDQEMFSQVHQDLSSPFRPNVSSYEGNERQTTPEKELKARQEKEKEQQQQLIKNNNFSTIKGYNNNDESTISADSPAAEDPSNQFFPSTEIAKAQDFTKVSAFTGEDERFAYKRAVSRLKEMTGSARWYKDDKGWLPVEDSARPWETIDEIQTRTQAGSASGGAGLGKPSSTSTDSPFRTRTDRPPKIDASHFWSLVEWGPGTRLKDPHAKEWIKGNTIYKIKG